MRFDDFHKYNEETCVHFFFLIQQNVVVKGIECKSCAN